MGKNVMAAGYTWDNEDCPHCEGELEQQDKYNVMCRDCMEIFEHRKTDSEHYLHQTDRGKVARISRTKSRSKP